MKSYSCSPKRPAIIAQHLNIICAMFSSNIVKQSIVREILIGTTIELREKEEWYKV